MACKTDCSQLVGSFVSSFMTWCKEEVAESDLILNRAAFFDLTQEEKDAMSVCPKHRQMLGYEWLGQRNRTCSNPLKECKNAPKVPTRVQYSWSQQLHQQQKIFLPAGSGTFFLQMSN